MSKPVELAKFEMRNVADLTNWENNPRSILEEDMARLKGQLRKLKVYKTLLVNQDNVVLGGNMRLRAFRELGLEQVMCGVVETKDEGEMLYYALSDNDQAGVTDDLKLAEVYALHPIDTQLLKVQSNTLRPLESIINPPDPVTEGGGDEVDRSYLDESLEQYLNGSIKQVVLYYDLTEYGEMIAILQDIMQATGAESNTAAATIAIRGYHAGITAQKEA